jgi:hypothetical protein
MRRLHIILLSSLATVSFSSKHAHAMELPAQAASSFSPEIIEQGLESLGELIQLTATHNSALGVLENIINSASAWIARDPHFATTQLSDFYGLLYAALSGSYGMFGANITRIAGAYGGLLCLLDLSNYNITLSGRGQLVLEAIFKSKRGYELIEMAHKLLMVKQLLESRSKI